MLNLETLSRDLFGIPPLAIQQRHDQAFDVEAVTAEFFREYRKVFEQTEAHLTVLDPDRRRLFTQKLFNRLLFIVFLERKGWLTFRGHTDYLRALWEDYSNNGAANGEDNFYWNRLNVLFFSGLNNAQNLMAINSGGYISDLIGNVPYLNGGLFEGDDNDENRNIVISDKIFEDAIENIFYRFNFTIAESTPLDIEVAVDPEMLGKIFEELVTGRHESGSYYTPKPVVSFMCREGLKGYLRTQLPNETQPMIARFVDSYDATQLRDPEAILHALQRVTVCDPACGSGAYLLGMMQELLLLRHALFTARNVDLRSMYDRKLEIIQNNIYGVDKDPIATNIAQLRLWLSLIVDFEGGSAGATPPLLPNLDYKIEQGDSLLSPDPSGGLQLDMFRQQQVSDYSAAKKSYLSAHGEEKLRLRREVERLRANIRQWAHAAEEAVVFDWAVDFVEVFDDGGFDIVLANPPYVRQELISDKSALRRIYNAFYSGTADLYTYFYARAVQMLKSGGMLVFISSNKWLRADYGTNLRTLLASDTRLEIVIDFGDLPVFGAIAYPVIIVAQREPPTGADVRVLTPSNLDRLDDLRGQVDDEAIDVAPASLRKGGWSFGDAAAHQRMETMRAAGMPLGEYVKGQIYYGIKTGLNEAFVINGPTRAALIAEDSKSTELIKPLATGKDIRKWTITDKDKWLIVTPIGIDIQRYPAIFDYLQQWQSDLEKRGDKGKYWWELRACDYYDAFEKPKIMFPDIAKDLRFSLDRTKLYGNNTMYFIPVDDLYLLGLLNSSIRVYHDLWYTVSPE
jgi:type I restriction-modification system DNA methylase subunit